MIIQKENQLKKLDECLSFRMKKLKYHDLKERERLKNTNIKCVKAAKTLLIKIRYRLDIKSASFDYLNRLHIHTEFKNKVIRIIFGINLNTVTYEWEFNDGPWSGEYTTSDALVKLLNEKV